MAIGKAEGPSETARVVLIPNPRKTGQMPGNFRQISLIDAIAKLPEALIRNRLLEEELDENNLISDSQYGFRKDRSTIRAVSRVIKPAKDHQTPNIWTIFITIDIRNAFNSANWNKIFQEFMGKTISAPMKSLIASYLSEADYVQGWTQETYCQCTPGVGLRPTLWNIFFDEVLEIDYGPGVNIVAYTDDIGILVKAKDIEELNAKEISMPRRIHDPQR